MYVIGIWKESFPFVLCSKSLFLCRMMVDHVKIGSWIAPIKQKPVPKLPGGSEPNEEHKWRYWKGSKKVLKN